MTRKAFLMKLRQQLVRRRDALRQTLAGDLRALRTAHDTGVGDALDDTLVWSENELHSRLAESESRELMQIEKALKRMRAGKFGMCENCGKVISQPRLEALPYAPSCIACAKEMERRRFLPENQRGNLGDEFGERNGSEMEFS